jgi:hypothetical protein
VNFPFLGSNIPASSAYGVYIHSKLIRYARVCVQYSDFLERGQLLSEKLLRDKSHLGYSHHSVDLLYKSTVHNSFVSYCLLNMTWNSAFIAQNKKNITRKFIITSKLFPNIMKVANCRNYILKPGI